MLGRAAAEPGSCLAMSSAEYHRSALGAERVVPAPVCWRACRARAIWPKRPQASGSPSGPARARRVSPMQMAPQCPRPGAARQAGVGQSETRAAAGCGAAARGEEASGGPAAAAVLRRGVGRTMAGAVQAASSVCPPEPCRTQRSGCARHLAAHEHPGVREGSEGAARHNGRRHTQTRAARRSKEAALGPTAPRARP